MLSLSAVIPSERHPRDYADGIFTPPTSSHEEMKAWRERQEELKRQIKWEGLVEEQAARFQLMDEAKQHYEDFKNPRQPLVLLSDADLLRRPDPEPTWSAG